MWGFACDLFHGRDGAQFRFWQFGALFCGKKKISRRSLSLHFYVIRVIINFLLIINVVVAFYPRRRKRTNAPSVVVVLLFFETREKERELCSSLSFVL